MTFRLSRRTLLRGASGIAIALPFLDAMEAAAAVGVGPAQRRFIFMFTPNGTLPTAWTPTGTETNFTFGEVLAPLNPYKSKLLVLDNVDMESAHHGPGDGHQKGMAHLLTGTELQAGTLFQGGGDSGTAGWGGGISVDQELAQKLTTGEPFRSIEFGVCVSSNNVWSRMCYAGPGLPLPPENSPANIFARIFRDADLSQPQPPVTGGSPDAGSPDAGAPKPDAGAPKPVDAGPDPLAVLRAQRRSVLDTVGESFRRVNGKVGAADKQKLDAHLTAIREIERRLAAEEAAYQAKLDAGAVVQPPVDAGAPGTPDAGPAYDAGTVAPPVQQWGLDCRKPAQPSTTAAYTNEANAETTGRLQMDLLAMALACGQTRVATLQWSKSVSQLAHPWAGVPDRHHDLSHFGDSDVAVQEKIKKINVWYAQQYAYLLGKLQGVREGDRTLLDNTVVVWGNELAKGNTHSRRDVPFVLAGSAGGYFRTGRYLKYGTAAYHNDLWVSCLNAMGVPATKFGNPAYSRGALANLR